LKAAKESPRVVTFGEITYMGGYNKENGPASGDVTEVGKKALQRARNVIGYKGDKELIGKVLDAQVRVSQIE
jgi:hypothetical protein